MEETTMKTCSICGETINETEEKHYCYTNQGSVLDVGCGLRPRGDVNVDLYIDSRQRRTGYGPHIDVDNVPNFVQTDATNMYMFHDKQFKIVRCFHLVEHINPPPARPSCWDLLRELWRVTDEHLIVEVPNRYWLRPFRTKRPFQHVSNFDAPTLRKALPIVLGTRQFELTKKNRGMIHPLIPFPYWPHLIRVDVYR